MKECSLFYKHLIIIKSVGLPKFLIFHFSFFIFNFDSALCTQHLFKVNRLKQEAELKCLIV